MRIAASILLKYIGHVLALGMTVGWLWGMALTPVLWTAVWTTLLVFVLADLLVLRLFGEGPALAGDAILGFLAIWLVTRAEGAVLPLEALVLATIALLVIEVLSHAQITHTMFERHRR